MLAYTQYQVHFGKIFMWRQGSLMTSLEVGLYSNSSGEHPPSSPHRQEGAPQHATLCTSVTGLLQRVACKLQPLQASRSLRSCELQEATVPTCCLPVGLHQQALESRAWLWRGAHPTTLLAGCVGNLSSPRCCCLLPGPPCAWFTHTASAHGSFTKMHYSPDSLVLHTCRFCGLFQFALHIFQETGETESTLWQT